MSSLEDGYRDQPSYWTRTLKPRAAGLDWWLSGASGFSLEVKPEWAPWAFAKGDPNKVIAALELLATLVGVQLWVPERDAKKTSRVAIRYPGLDRQPVQ